METQNEKKNVHGKNRAEAIEAVKAVKAAKAAKAAKALHGMVYSSEALNK